MALTLLELVGYQEAAEDETKTLEDVVLEIATKQLEEKGRIDDSIYDTIIGRVDEELYHVDETTGYISQSVKDTSQSDFNELSDILDAISDAIGGISVPGLSQLLGSLSGIGEAVLAPVLAVLATFGEHITAIKEFITNLASDIASGMESAFEVIGTIVVDPLLGILSAFGDYLGVKISGFIENAIGEQ